MAKNKNIFDANFSEVSKQITKQNFSNAAAELEAAEAAELEAAENKKKSGLGRPTAKHTRKKYTVMIEPILMKQLKQKALIAEKNVSDILEVLIKEYLDQ